MMFIERFLAIALVIVLLGIWLGAHLLMLGNNGLGSSCPEMMPSWPHNGWISGPFIMLAPAIVVIICNPTKGAFIVGWRVAYAFTRYGVVCRLCDTIIVSDEYWHGRHYLRR